MDAEIAVAGLSYRLDRIERALRDLDALHVCDAVKSPAEPCPICSMMDVLNDGKTMHLALGENEK